MVRGRISDQEWAFFSHFLYLRARRVAGPRRIIDVCWMAFFGLPEQALRAGFLRGVW
jgi:hypothetical protein